jgi:hypothetical protein
MRELRMPIAERGTASIRHAHSVEGLASGFVSRPSVQMRELCLVDILDELSTPARPNDYRAHESKGIAARRYGIVVAFHG